MWQPRPEDEDLGDEPPPLLGSDDEDSEGEAPELLSSHEIGPRDAPPALQLLSQTSGGEPWSSADLRPVPELLPLSESELQLRRRAVALMRGGDAADLDRRFSEPSRSREPDTAGSSRIPSAESGDMEVLASEMFRRELERSRERELEVAQRLRERLMSRREAPDFPASGSLSARGISEALSSGPSPLAPPPLEPLVAEESVVLGLLVQWPTTSDRANRRAAFTVVCEVRTFLQSEFALEHAERYQRSPRFSPLPRGQALNPHRLRCLSEHSWTLLLLLEAGRERPRERVFSDAPASDELAVWGWDVASAREQLRRDGWFGYNFRRCEQAFARSRGRWLM